MAEAPGARVSRLPGELEREASNKQSLRTRIWDRDMSEEVWGGGGVGESQVAKGNSQESLPIKPKAPVNFLTL